MSVRRFRDPALLLRVLLPLVVLPFLGLTARPHELREHLLAAGRAREFASPAGMAAHLAQVAELQPWRLELWERAGIYAFQGGDVQSARAYLERAAALGPLSPQGNLTLGDIQRQSGDLQAALRSWEAALPGGDPAQVYTRLLDAHRSQGDVAAVAADLQALAALDPSDISLRYQLGLHLAAQEPLAALAHLAQVADLEPALQKPAQALIAGIRTASLAEDPAYTLLESGRVLASLGEWTLAAAALRKSAQLRPDYAEAWAYLGEALQHSEPAEAETQAPDSGQTPGGSQAAGKGLAELEKALELDPNSLVANTLAALYWQRQQRFDRAQAYLEKVTQLYPDNPTLHAELGSTLALLGNLEAAEQAYQRAVDLSPRSADTWRLLAAFSVKYEVHLRMVGLPAARRAAALGARDPANHDILGQVLLLLGDLTSARRLFQHSLEIDASYALARVHLGLVYQLQGDEQGARKEWHQVLDQAPGTPAAGQAQRLIQNYFP